MKTLQPKWYPHIRVVTEERVGSVEERFCDKCGAHEAELLKPDRANPRFPDATKCVEFY